MLQLYSKGCEYVIRAMTLLGSKESRGGFSVRTVCKKSSIPESYTRKIFQSLVRHGILSAQPGPGGGYRFKKDPSEVSLLHLIHAVDGPAAMEKCVMKDFKCDARNYCCLHKMWTKAKSGIVKELETTTVAELMRGDR